jgi:hypothetical protein
LKQSYVSLVLPVDSLMPSYAQLLIIDQLLERQTRGHEIVLTTPFTGEVSSSLEKTHFSGPVSIVFTSLNANKSKALITGLARCAGDIIVEWHGSIDSFSEKVFLSLMEPINLGAELVELEVTNNSLVSKIFYKVTNLFRSKNVPVRKIVSRAYSRRALAQILSAVKFEPQLNLLFAELSLYRKVLKSGVEIGAKESWKFRIIEGVTLLLKGSRFGTTVPLLLAVISAVFGIAVSIYAFVLYALIGKSPEGWTTLMIVTGLGQASILALIGLLLTRIDSIVRGLSGQIDATTKVVIIPPKL